METRTLLLNSWAMPHAILSWDEAISLVYQGKVSVLEEYDEIVSSPSVSYFIPAVIQLKHQVAMMKKGVKFSRINVFTRDGFTCFVAGTKVLMADGRQAPIEAVEVGDSVIDAYGNPQSVVAKNSRLVEKAVSIKARRSYEHTIVTEEHPFMVPGDQYVPISERPEYLVVPRAVSYTRLPVKDIWISDYLPKDHWFRFRNGRVYWSRRGHEPGFPVTLPATEELSYILGLYCAEGSAKVVAQWSFCDDEEHSLAEHTFKYLNSIGLNPAKDVNSEHHTCNVRVSSKILCAFLRSACGVHSQGKRVPWEVIGPYHEAFLRGVFLGDGSLRTPGKASLTMTSSDVIFGVESMLWGFGIHPSVQFLSLPGRKPAWTLILQGEAYSLFMRKILGKEVPPGEPIFGDSSYIYRKLGRVEEVEGPLEVFNIEVSGTHSYIANGMAVHNCQYCGQRKTMSELNYDHVVPRKQGGKTTWSNVTTSCYPCNEMKAGRTPEQAGMKLLRKPAKPHSLPLHAVYLDSGRVPLVWEPYLDWSRAQQHGRGYYLVASSAA